MKKRFKPDDLKHEDSVLKKACFRFQEIAALSRKGRLCYEQLKLGAEGWI
ncbi:hypothetical protein IM774_03840 [Erysipelotrichaceae bacterium RD49]|nr:hypothetical protein [Erysipelotrichaceae bacterium RD49]